MFPQPLDVALEQLQVAAKLDGPAAIVFQRRQTPEAAAAPVQFSARRSTACFNPPRNRRMNNQSSTKHQSTSQKAAATYDSTPHIGAGEADHHES